MKTILAAAASATALSLALAASPASANTFEVTDVVVNPDGPELTISNAYNSQDDVTTLAGAIGLYITGRAQPLWVFCVDIPHHIYLGIQSPPLAYTVSSVTTDSNGFDSGTQGTGDPAFTTLQSEEIATLVGEGSSIAYNHPSDTFDLLAIQGAIWGIEYGATVTGALPGIDAAILADESVTPSSHDAVGFYPVGSGQGFGTSQGFALAGVPEPASWAFMIVGLGGIGGAVRRRRGALATA
jgi:PEP-CTERM motif